MALRSSQAVPGCQGFNTHVQLDSNGRARVKIGSCPIGGVYPKPLPVEPFPFPADLCGGNFQAVKGAAKPECHRDAMAKVDATGATQGPAPAITQLERPSPLPYDSILHFDTYEVEGAALSKVVAALDAIEAIERPEMLLPVVCLPAPGSHVLTVEHGNASGVRHYSSFNQGGRCPYDGAFRAESMLKAHDLVVAIATSEGKHVGSDAGGSRGPGSAPSGTGSPAPRPVSTPGAVMPLPAPRPMK